jgi:hypothetical protein
MAKTSQYTDPELRERLKAEITAGDRGGRPGQWSARKAQLLAGEYKKAGGGYTTDKSDESASAQHLDEWTSEEWQTADGDDRARHGVETSRYLPKQAWEELTPQQRRETDRRKRAESKQGKQFVGNTEPAKEAGRHAREHGDSDEPFPGYAGTNAKDLLKQLKDLDADTLRRVQSFEKSHGVRKTVLERVEAALAG